MAMWILVRLRSLGTPGRLAAMMFLEFFVWGAWFTSLGQYMNAQEMGEWIPLAYSVCWAGAIVSPIFLGMIADRFFPTQFVLAGLHIVGGALLLWAPYFGEGTGKNPQLFVTMIFLNMLCFMPTMGLCNSLAFRSLTNQEKQFPIIRVFGTLGWIVAGIVVSQYFKADQTNGSLRIGGVAGVLMGFYSLLLPHTPPPAKGQPFSLKTALGLDALVLLRSRSFAVFLACSFLISAPLSAYYNYTGNYLSALGDARPTFTQTYGQMSEVFFMVAMPLFFRALGVKWMLAVGMLAWVARYGFYAVPTDSVSPLIYVAIALHGICYDFFFVTGYIYTDKRAPAAIRAQAQQFVILVTLGIGMIMGSQLMGRLHTYLFANDSKMANLEQWRKFWMVPAIASAVIFVIFFLLFKDDTKKAGGAEEAAGN